MARTSGAAAPAGSGAKVNLMFNTEGTLHGVIYWCVFVFCVRVCVCVCVWFFIEERCLWSDL